MPRTSASLRGLPPRDALYRRRRGVRNCISDTGGMYFPVDRRCEREAQHIDVRAKRNASHGFFVILNEHKEIYS